MTTPIGYFTSIEASVFASGVAIEAKWYEGRDIAPGDTLKVAMDNGMTFAVARHTAGYYYPTFVFQA